MDYEFTSCAIEGCERNAHKTGSGRKGFCSAHYTRILRHGDPLAGRPEDGSGIRFVNEVAVPYKGKECLIWPYGRNKTGYGQIKGQRALQPHRLVCILVHGEPPSPKMHAAHNCGNGHLGCINPNHLEWKTPKENESDKFIHGRHNRGEKNGHAKLTANDARKILAFKGVKTQREIAEEFGISRQNVSDIHLGRRWSWLEQEAPVARYFHSIAAE